MQFIFVEFWVTLEIILYVVNHGQWHFGFGIEVKQTDCTFQLNKNFRKKKKSCILRGSIMQVLRF